MIKFFTRLLGIFLCLIGLIIAPTPIPIGLILFMMGLILLIPTTPWAARLLRWLRKKIPFFNRFMTKATKKAPAAYQKHLDQTDPNSID